MQIFRYFVLMTLMLSLGSTTVLAQTAVDKRLGELEQEMKILKRQLELEKEEKAKELQERPIITAAAKDGFSIKSPDDSFKIRIRGLLQLDSRIFADNRKDLGTIDTFVVRRARPIFEGTVARDFDFYLMPDFGSGSSTLTDGYLEYKYFPKAKLRAGKFKVPFGLERLQSDSVSNFVEAGLPINLTANRDVGVQLHGDVLDKTVNYAVGIFNGVADNTSSDTDNNNDKEVAVRVFTQPWDKGEHVLRGLGVGIAATYGHKEGSSIPTYRSSGQAAIFNYASGISTDGDHLRLSPQVFYYYRSFGLLGEYVSSDQELVRTSGGTIINEDAENNAWQISASYVLTGEDASYKGVTPRQSFDLRDGTWGAWQIVGRYSLLDVEDEVFTRGFANPNTAVSEAQAWGAGLNWYLNRNVRISLDYENTAFEGGATGGSDRENEHVLLTRFQLGY